MSLKIKISELTSEQTKNVTDFLRIQPTNKKQEKMKKWGKTGSAFSKLENKSPIDMFIVEDEFIYIPFRFSCSLLNKMSNKDKIYPTFEPQFKAMLREYQVSAALESKQQLFKFGTTTLNLHTGFGKTIIGAWLYYFTKTYCCVLVTNQLLLSSWYNTFKMCFPKYIDNIWIVGEDKCDDPKIIICMDTRVNQISPTLQASIGCLIIDEAHLFCTASRVKALLIFQPKFIIVESATLSRNDGMEQMIHTIAGTHSVNRISNKPYTVIKYNTGIEVELVKNRFGTNFNELCKSLIEHEGRNKMIVEIVKNNPHRKFMIVTRRKDHVEKLRDLFEAETITCDTLYGTKSSYTDTRVLLGNLQKMGTGFDESNSAENYGGRPSDTMILALSIAGDSDDDQILTFEQVRGRITRSNNPCLIYFVDKIAMIKRHFTDKLKWIEYTNGTIKEIDSNDTVPGYGIKIS